MNAPIFLRHPLVALSLLVLLAAPVSAEACVGCREPGSLTLNHENPTVLAGIGFSWSVIFMLVFVLSVVAAMTFYIWRTCQQLEKSRIRP